MMKFIKFFSLALVLTLSWVACKNNAAEATATTETTAADSVFTAGKATAMANIEGLTSGVDAKIAEIEGNLAAAQEANKGGLNVELETFKKFKTDLEAMAGKVNQATPETWAAINTEVEALHYTVKTAIVGAVSSDQLH